jgi:hypothetical protein
MVIIKIKLQGGRKMGKIVVPNAVERKEGFLYYIDGQGNLCEAAMRNSKKKDKQKKLN